MHRKMLIKHCFAQDKLEHQPNYELQSFQKYSLSKYILMHFVPMLGFGTNHEITISPLYNLTLYTHFIIHH